MTRQISKDTFNVKCTEKRDSYRCKVKTGINSEPDQTVEVDHFLFGDADHVNSNPPPGYDTDILAHYGIPGKPCKLYDSNDGTTLVCGPDGEVY